MNKSQSRYWKCCP